MCQDSRFKAILIVLLVAAGSWYAKQPEAADRYLSPASTGAGSQDGSTRFVRAAWLPDSNRLLTLARRAGCQSSFLVQQNLTGANPAMSVDLGGEMISTFSVSPDGRHALFGTIAGHLWWIGLDSDQQTTMFEFSPPSFICSTAVSPDGRWAAAADDVGRVVLCPAPPTTASFSAAYARLPTMSLQEWSRVGNVVLTQDLRSSSRDLQFSESGDRLLWAGCDGLLRVWDVQSKTLLQTFRGEQKPMTAALFLPGEDRIMSASLDDTIRIWSVASGQEIWRGQFGFLGVTALALSPDRRTAAWGGNNRKILVWNIEQRRTEFTIETPASLIWGLQFSPDGKSLAAVGQEGPIRVYNATTGAEQPGIDVGIQ